MTKCECLLHACCQYMVPITICNVASGGWLWPELMPNLCQHDQLSNASHLRCDPEYLVHLQGTTLPESGLLKVATGVLQTDAAWLAY